MPKLSEFLRDFFVTLNTSEIEYCVIGKTFSKFDINTTSDIDIITTENDLKKCLDIIVHLTHDQDIFLLNFINYGFRSFYIIISDRRYKKNSLHKIDICSEYKITSLIESKVSWTILI